jgi:hypothetical protein
MFQAFEDTREETLQTAEWADCYHILSMAFRWIMKDRGPAIRGLR